MPINTFETSFEARDRRYQVEKLYHGETVDLVGVITTDGVLKNITGYSVQGVFQPTTKQGTDEFYELSADIVDNKVIVHWDKGKDFGEPSYMVWALLTDGNDASYPIVWRLDMAYSPNFPLSALDPIPKTIDFSKYELLNAPWAMLSDFQDLQEDVSELSDGLSAYAKKEDIPEVEGKYLPLSGGIVTGTLSVDGTFESSNFKGAAGIMIGYNAKAKTGSIAIGSSSNVTNAHYVGSNVAIGTAAKIGSISETDCAVAVGIGATVNGDYGIAIGHSANAEGANSIAIGSSGSRVQALAPESIQIGGLSNGLWTPNNTPHSLKVFDKMVLSGDNLTLDPERVPYLSGYAKKEDIPEVPTDLSAFTNSPGYLTAHQSLSDYYTKEEADGKFLTAHQDLTDYAKKEEVQAVDDKLSNYLPLSGGTLTGSVTVNHILTTANLEAPGIEALEDIVNIKADHLSAKNDLIVKKSIVFGDDSTISSANDLATKEELTAYAQLSDVPVLPDDLVHEDELSDYAQLSDIPELPEDLVHEDELSVYAQLSDLENIDVPEISACLSSDEFADVEELGAAETVSFQDLVDKVNLVIQKLKRTWKDPRYTWVTYRDNSVSSFNITGSFDASNITNYTQLKEVYLGTNVTSIARNGFIYKWWLEKVTIPSTVTSIGVRAFEDARALPTIIFYGKTRAEVQAMSNYPWSLNTGSTIVCTDGDITL